MRSSHIFYIWFILVALLFTFSSVLLKVLSFQVVALIFQGSVALVTIIR